jgi:hypothetical protein
LRGETEAGGAEDCFAGDPVLGETEAGGTGDGFAGDPVRGALPGESEAALFISGLRTAPGTEICGL